MTIDEGIRAETAKHIGDLTVAHICNVALAKKLEAENEELRRMVTEARQEAQTHKARADETAAYAASLERQLDELRAQPSKTPRRAPPRPSK